MAMIEKSPNSESTKIARKNGENTPDSRAPADARNTTASEPRLYEVEIAGIALRLKSSHDQQTVNELVQLVDGKIREALPLTKTGSVQNASILASLHLAEEYILLKRKANVELSALEQKALKLISDLETSQSSSALDN